MLEIRGVHFIHLRDKYNAPNDSRMRYLDPRIRKFRSLIKINPTTDQERFQTLVVFGSDGLMQCFEKIWWVMDL